MGGIQAFIFPGQGAQYVGMGKGMYDRSSRAREYFQRADKVLGFSISEVMFTGSEEDLKQTRVTQPSVFLHSVVLALLYPDFTPSMVAGHSLGEYSALVAARSLSFEEGLQLVSQRAEAMQAACEAAPSTMAAVLGLPDEEVERICGEVDEVVVPANYNSPGQVVISGTLAGVERASELLREAGAKRVLPLKVGGAFHSPLMECAAPDFSRAIDHATFKVPLCPVYQNVDGDPHSDPSLLVANLKKQLYSPVRWTRIVENMVADGATSFVELGPGKVLQGLVKKIAPKAEVVSYDDLADMGV